MLKLEAKDVLVIISWGFLMAAIILQALYANASLAALDILLLFVVSVVAGMLLIDIKTILLGYTCSFSLSVLITFICLTLPMTLGTFEYAAQSEALYRAAVFMIFTSFFPAPIILCLIGGFLGSAIGERLNLS